MAVLDCRGKIHLNQVYLCLEQDAVTHLPGAQVNDDQPFRSPLFSLLYLCCVVGCLLWRPILKAKTSLTLATVSLQANSWCSAR